MNDTNLKRAYEKLDKLSLDFIDAVLEGKLSHYHVTEKAKPLKQQLEFVKGLFDGIKEDDVVEDEWEEIKGNQMRFVSRLELRGDYVFENLKGKNFEVWSQPPETIRLPFRAIKPLEFEKELSILREACNAGSLIYEVK